MLPKSAVLFILSLGVAAPAAANDAFAIRNDLPPGVYTLNELVQIVQAGSEREMRMYLIDRKKQAFRDRVETSLGRGEFQVEVTRTNGR